MRYLVELNNFESPSEKHAREVAEAAARGEAHPAKKLRTPEPEDLNWEPSCRICLDLSRSFMTSHYCILVEIRRTECIV